MSALPKRLTVFSRTRSAEHEVLVVDKTAGPDAALPLAFLISTPILELDETHAQPSANERLQIDGLCEAFEAQLLNLGARFAGRLTSSTKRVWLYYLPSGRETEAASAVERAVTSLGARRQVSVESLEDSGWGYYTDHFKPPAQIEQREIPRAIPTHYSAPRASVSIPLVAEVTRSASTPPPLPKTLGSLPLSPPSLLTTPRAKTDSLAIIAFVCSTFGFFCLLLGPLLGIILGFVSRARIRRSNGQRTGEGFAKAAIILGCLGILFILGLFGIVVSGKVPGLNPARIQEMQQQMKQRPTEPH